ncbi:hypothetical protein KGF54_004475 [Candida jiufengensis]|uniref:uncharacterized protein n=1 Tax=Candida jiufengensis TaxID=497108 RepID=UPI002224A95E|nr:uncharacterized protein KGF54_004475 [Candida jiufengensis]KAI5951401.1 hypothetical protein KGF54_004475 [Candida jiufengensis]
MENLDNIKLFLKSLDNATTQYESSLTPLLSKSIDEQLALITSPKDKINFLNNYQYILISTIFTYLKVIGVDTDQQPIKKELNRIKSYMMRLQQLNQTQDIKKDDTTTTTKEFLKQTLGVKNGNENTVDKVGPAISTQSFQGKHTKFEESKESDSDEEDIKGQSSTKRSIPSPKKKPAKGKVTKPTPKTNIKKGNLNKSQRK